MFIQSDYSQTTNNRNYRVFCKLFLDLLVLFGDYTQTTLYSILRFMADFSVVQENIFIDSDVQVNRLQADLVQKIARLMNEASHSITENIKDEIKRPQGPPGRAYKRKGRVHIASSEKWPPRYDTGKLYRGTYYTPAKTTGPDALQSEMGSNPMRAGAKTDYAVYLVTGTRKMKPRPYFYRIIAERVGETEFREMVRDIRSAVRQNLLAYTARPGKRVIV